MAVEIAGDGDWVGVAKIVADGEFEGLGDFSTVWISVFTALHPLRTKTPSANDTILFYPNSYQEMSFLIDSILSSTKVASASLTEWLL